MLVVQCEGAVLTYGSCKLEAADAEADMDLICVAPGVGSVFRNRIQNPPAGTGTFCLSGTGMQNGMTKVKKSKSD